MSVITEVHQLIEECDSLVETAATGAEKAEVILAKRHFEDAVNRLERANGLAAEARLLDGRV